LLFVFGDVCKRLLRFAEAKMLADLRFDWLNFCKRSGREAGGEMCFEEPMKTQIGQQLRLAPLSSTLKKASQFVTNTNYTSHHVWTRQRRQRAWQGRREAPPQGSA
jgi:hypothetical protein